MITIQTRRNVLIGWSCTAEINGTVYVTIASTANEAQARMRSQLNKLKILAGEVKWMPIHPTFTRKSNCRTGKCNPRPKQ